MKKMKVNITFRRSDFSQSALDLGIWNELTRDLPADTQSVEVSGVRWVL